MPLIKSTSKKAFGENIARERAAGRPERQAVAIAASEASEAGKARKKPSKTAHHSEHSGRRSDHYHAKIAATLVRPSSTKMTRAEHQLNNDEDMSEKGHKL